MDEFIKLAAQNDTEFESILIDELPTQYRKDLNLPVRDIIRASESEFSELGLSDASISDNHLIDFITAHPKLLQRPIVVNAISISIQYEDNSF